MNPYEIYGSQVEERPTSKYGREEEPYNRPVEPYRRRSPGELSGFSCSWSSKVKFCGEASRARIRQRVKPLFKERRLWAARVLDGHCVLKTSNGSEEEPSFTFQLTLRLRMG